MVDAEERDPSKSDLLERAERLWAEWQQLVAAARGRFLEPGAAGDWTPKDVAAHVCAYQRFVLGLMGGRVRELPQMPDEIGWDTHRRNTWMYELDRDRSAEDVLSEADDVYAGLVEQIRARDDAALRAPLVDWSDWPAWRWVVSVTEGHYEEHVPPLRAWLQSTG